MTDRKGNGADEDPTARAEHVVDDFSHRLDDWSATVEDWVSRAVARGREEAEDIWAEAQSIKRGD